MVKFFSQGQGATFTANGSNDGTIAVASTSGFYPGATAWVLSDTVASLRVIIRAVVDATHLKVGIIAVGDSRNADLSSYVTADNARINQEPQLVSDEVGRV